MIAPMSNEMDGLLQSFEEWILFVNDMKGLDEKVWNSSLERGTWTIRSIVSHMMLWDKYFYEEAIQKIASAQRVTLKHINFDDFNSKAIEYGNTITINEMIEKAAYYRQKIINEIRTLSKEAIAGNYIDGDGNVFHVPQYLKDFIGHDQHHMTPLREYLNTVEA